MVTLWNTFKKPILALAPMVDVTDTAFRIVCKEWGADIVYSEMISADAIVHNAPKAWSMMTITFAEQPCVVQLMGKDPDVMARAAKLAVAHGAAGIDINFGCPANKITKNMSGVMLMRDPELSRRIIESLVNAVEVPISIKVRTSIKKANTTGRVSPEKHTIQEFLSRLSDLPIAAIMVHGRSFEDSYRGGINYAVIAEVKSLFTAGPVLANGGIVAVESASELLSTTGADGIGFARSVIGHPWIFKQVREYLATGSFEQISWTEIKTTILRHAELFESHRGKRPFRDMRHHLTHYIRGHSNATEIRKQLVTVNSIADVGQVLSRY